jgi:hypothetical protein
LITKQDLKETEEELHGALKSTTEKVMDAIDYYQRRIRQLEQEKARLEQEVIGLKSQVEVMKIANLKKKS